MGICLCVGVKNGHIVREKKKQELQSSQESNKFTNKNIYKEDGIYNILTNECKSSQYEETA